MSRWSDAENLRFVNLYKHCRMLWDVEDPNYSKTPIRNQAYVLIQNKMGMDDVDAVRRKIRSFRNTYLSEAKKIRKSEQLYKVNLDHELYKPRIKWFAIMDGCMGGAPCGTDEWEEFVPDETVAEYEPTICQVIYFDPESILEQQQDTNSLCRVSSANVNNLTHKELPSKDDIDNFIEHELSSTARKTRTRDSVNLRHEPNYEVNLINGSQTLYDEFYYFGMNIAYQLRAMPLDEALECQADVMNYIARKRRHIFGINHVNRK